MSVEDVEIRPCRDEDVDCVLAMWARAGTKPTPHDNPESIRARLAYGNELFFVAADGERLVGSLIGGWDGWIGNMYRLAVDPDYRRAGLGSRLVRTVEDELRQLGATRVTALLFVDVEPAKEFWRSVGYELDPTIERWRSSLD